VYAAGLADDPVLARRGRGRVLRLAARRRLGRNVRNPAERARPRKDRGSRTACDLRPKSPPDPRGSRSPSRKLDMNLIFQDVHLSDALSEGQTVAMLAAQTTWLVERLHVDLGRARSMMCR